MRDMFMVAAACGHIWGLARGHVILPFIGLTALIALKVISAKEGVKNGNHS